MIGSKALTVNFSLTKKKPIHLIIIVGQRGEPGLPGLPGLPGAPGLRGMVSRN